MSRLDMFQRLCICLLLTVLGSTGHLCGQQTDSEPRQFTGSFEELSPPQTRLVEDWFARYNRVMNKNVSAADGFDLLPQSVKTTFDGVTHALMTSNLTDESGDSLGTALDLVASIETVRGRIEGGRGDHQFRMYCRLIEGAREILEKSVEFGRGHDNTVYHKGYPLSYRQQGGTPSIQVSMTEDGSRADIDVDYRSSKFPAALLNGHLTSANSDIRSGNNFDRHSGRWSGLQNWWANWFALPFIQADMVDDAEQDTRIPARPPKGRKIEQAAFDFLNSWLAEQKPEIAMSYVSSRAFQCLSIDQEAELDLGMAPFQMLAGLKKVNQSLGTVSELTDVLTGIRIPDPELRVVRQKNHAAFVLYNVPESRALAFDCANRGLPANEVPKGSKTKYGKYFATVQHIQPKTGGGQSLALLWGKEGKDWKIISYLTEPVADEIDVPDLTEGIVTGESPTIEGDSAQIEAAAGFVEAWFGAKDPSRAIGYFADESLECVNLFLRDGETPYEGLGNVRNRVLLGLQRTVDGLGSYERIADVLSPIEPVHPDLPVVSHEHESVFTLMGLPDYVAGNYGCAYRASGGARLERPEKPQLGNYYVLAFQVKTYTGEPAVLFTVWAKRSGSWKITAFHIAQP